MIQHTRLVPMIVCGLIMLPLTPGLAQTDPIPPEFRQDEKKVDSVKAEADRARQELNRQLQGIRQIGPANPLTPVISPAQSEDSLSQLIASIKRAHSDRQVRLNQLAAEIESVLEAIEQMGQPRQDMAEVEDANQPTKPERVPDQLAEAMEQGQPKVADNSTGSTDDVTTELIGLSQSPVDEIGLANNLYASGSIDMALKIYTKVHQTIPEREQNWVRFQMANCYQRKQLFDEAERLYREVANSDIRDIANSMSKWRLDQMQNRRTIMTELAAMDAQIQKFRPAKSTRPADENENN